MLFGHQNDDNKQSDTVINDVSAPATSNMPLPNPLAIDPDTGFSLPAEPLEHSNGSQPHASVSQSVSDDLIADELLTAQTPTPVAAHDDLIHPAADDELLHLKQAALEQLGPLVDHLDQTPEEKFRITMMMIQSSDNDSLIKVAYEAAQAITDDKARAQALLDVVNEINYFTQKQD